MSRLVCVVSVLHVCGCAAVGQTVALVTELTFLTVINHYGNSTSIFRTPAPQKTGLAWPHPSYKYVDMTRINDTKHRINLSCRPK